MAKFAQEVKIPHWFGDFGGSIATDTDTLNIMSRASKIEAVLSSTEFDQQFDKNLSFLIPEKWTIEKYDLSKDFTCFIAPGLSRYFNLAGQFAVATLLGYKKIQTGTYSRNMAVAYAKISKYLGMQSEITLSRELSSDATLISQLNELGCMVDSSMCGALLDLPYAYYERAFSTPADYYVIILEANYGLYPKPGLVGLLAGLYGKVLRNALDNFPECCVVPINTGTEAIGVLSAFLQTKCTLITVEEPISQEFHITDSGTYTISTRNAQHEEMNITLCPELVNWWRTGQVTRLGCDTLNPVDADYLQNKKISPKITRAISLAQKKTGCSNMLVIGGEDK